MLVMVQGASDTHLVKSLDIMVRVVGYHYKAFSKGSGRFMLEFEFWNNHAGYSVESQLEGC